MPTKNPTAFFTELPKLILKFLAYTEKSPQIRSVQLNKVLQSEHTRVTKTQIKKQNIAPETALLPPCSHYHL